MPRRLAMGVVIRRATVQDADGIAQAHVDSIQTLGARAYDAEVIADWGAPRTGERYRLRIADGAELFVAVENGRIVGLSDYRAIDGSHRTGIFVRGDAARRGIGTALFAEAEAAARRHGATEINVDASLGAVGFYEANGFERVGDGEHTLRNGRRMSCVYMRKRLQ